MPEYVPYYGFSALMRKIEKITHQKLNSYDHFLDFSFTLMKEGRKADFFTMIIESNHYFMSHHVLLLSKNLGESILNSKINIKLDNLKLPFSTFEVSFDKTMKIPNTDIPMPSVLCSFYESQSTQDFTDKFINDMQNKFHLQNPIQIFYPKRLVAFRMADPRPDNPYLRSTFIFNLDRDFCKDMDIDAAVENSPTLDSADSALDKEENLIVKTVAKLTLGVICYLNLENHEKEVVKDRNRPRMGITPKVLLLGKQCSPSAFMRSGHFRELAHQRFKRDDLGYTRKIWVREHQVNAHDDPKEKDAKNTVVEELI